MLKFTRKVTRQVEEDMVIRARDESQVEVDMILIVNFHVTGHVIVGRGRLWDMLTSFQPIRSGDFNRRYDNEQCNQICFERADE